MNRAWSAPLILIIGVLVLLGVAYGLSSLLSTATIQSTQTAANTLPSPPPAIVCPSGSHEAAGACVRDITVCPAGTTENAAHECERSVVGGTNAASPAKTLVCPQGQVAQGGECQPESRLTSPPAKADRGVNDIMSLVTWQDLYKWWPGLDIFFALLLGALLISILLRVLLTEASTAFIVFIGIIIVGLFVIRFSQYFGTDGLGNWWNAFTTAYPAFADLMTWGVLAFVIFGLVGSAFYAFKEGELIGWGLFAVFVLFFLLIGGFSTLLSLLPRDLIPNDSGLRSAVIVLIMLALVVAIWKSPWSWGVKALGTAVLLYIAGINFETAFEYGHAKGWYPSVRDYAATTTTGGRCDGKLYTVTLQSSFQPIRAGCNVNWGITDTSPGRCVILFDKNSRPIPKLACSGHEREFASIPITGWQAADGITVVDVIYR